MSSDTITLIVEQNQYEFSKKKLIENSSYFTAMFKSEFSEKYKSVIKLEGVSARSWEHILYYLSHARIKTVPKKNLVDEMLELLEAASMLRFLSIKENCTKILYDELDISNAIPVLEVASKLDSANLIRKARAIVLWYFDDVTKQETFYKLKLEQVEGYVSDPALHSWTGEWGVWEAIDRWINSPEDLSESRTGFTPRLVKCLHLDSLTLSDLRCMVLYDSIQASPVVLNSIQRVIKERTSIPKESEVDSSSENPETEDCNEITEFLEDWRKAEPRKLPLSPSVVGNIRSCPNTVSPGIIRFCETENKFIPVLRLDKVENSLGSMVGFKVICEGSKLFMLGGEMMTKQSAWNHAVWMYDQIYKSWTFLSNLLKPRRHPSACCIGNDLYVMGGFGRHRVVQNTVYKLSLKDRIWTMCAPLPRPMFSVVCVAFRNCIYIFDSAVYQYNPSMDSWITMNTSLDRVFFCAMANDEFIFLSEAYGRSIYKFSPENPSGKLELVGSFKKECVQCCLIDDYIYSLSQDEFEEDIYCEKLNIKTGENVVLWEGTTDFAIADLDPKHHHGCFPLLLY